MSLILTLEVGSNYRGSLFDLLQRPEERNRLDVRRRLNMAYDVVTELILCLFDASISLFQLRLVFACFICRHRG